MSGRREINYYLEGLRGIAALTVAIAHVVNSDLLNVGYSSILSYMQFAHIAVLLFFVLSGYVIGINYPGEFDVKLYLKKRLVRIYPIYLIVILFCFLIEPNMSWAKVWETLFVLQGPMDGLSSNVVLWSIHFEIFFYILFPLLPKRKNSLLAVLAITSLVSAIVWMVPTIPQILGTYASGYSFWLAGLYLSKASETDKPAFDFTFAASILLLFCYNHLQPGVLVLNAIQLSNDQRGIVSLADLFCLPLCLSVIAQLTKRRISNYDVAIKYLVLALPMLFVIYFTVTKRIVESLRWEIVGISFGLFVLLSWIKIKIPEYKSFYRFGSISYALYIIHYPLAFYLGMINSSKNYFIILAWISLSLFFAYVLEHRIQPLIRTVVVPSKKI